MASHTEVVLIGVILGLILAAGELFVPASVFLWAGISLVLTALLWWLAPTLSIIAIVVIWVILSVITVLSARWIIKRTGTGGDRVVSPDTPNEYAAQFVGRRVNLKEDSANGNARININGAEWGVKLPGGDLKAGTEIRITGADGIYLIGEPTAQT
ncbi:MAG: NfeD family protein [Gammaproteobacteria bacterium]